MRTDAHTVQNAAHAARSRRLDIAAPLRMGYAVIAVFFVLGVGGAAIAPIDKGIGVPGTIIVESKVKPVAHLRGGVVASIEVVEGAQVEAGALLVRLETSTMDEQIDALRAQLAAANRQHELAREESETIDALEARKLAAKSKALALKRMVSEIEKEVAGIRAKIAAGEAERVRTEIRAPVAGRVLSLRVHAAGAIVQPGEIIAEIVPASDKLVIEGRLQPNQLENVVPGMEAKVWLSALSWRDRRPLAARLAWISPDSIEDKRTGAPLFLARVELDQDTANTLPALQPGMRAEVLLLTGQRTLLDQLIDPLMRNVHKAFNG